MTDNNQNGQQGIQIPDFVLNIIGKLQLENEILKGEVYKLQQQMNSTQAVESERGLAN